MTDSEAQLAGLRHDLRTPLNAVIGYSELLLEDVGQGDGSDALYPRLSRIQSAGNRLLDLVDQTVRPGHEAPGEALRAPMREVIGCCEALIAEVEGTDRAELVADLGKIHAAAERFLALTGAEAAAAPRIAAAPVPHAPDGNRSGASRHPVLIVDDDEINRDVLGRHLARQGLATATADHGRRALELVRKRPFDLVLLDVMMPEMNGYEVLRRLKADPRLRDIPVIMISALDDLASVVRCIELGADDYLPKPFDPVLLRARTGACLEKKRLRDAEVEYLRSVDRVTAAAGALEAGAFDAEAIAPVAARQDELGRLARVFGRMAGEVRAREQRLKRQVQQLQIEIDETRTARQVAAITETDYFRDLQAKADRLRARADRDR